MFKVSGPVYYKEPTHNINVAYYTCGVFLFIFITSGTISFEANSNHIIIPNMPTGYCDAYGVMGGNHNTNKEIRYHKTGQLEILSSGSNVNYTFYGNLVTFKLN